MNAGSVIIFTDGEPDDWIALYIFAKLCKNSNMRMVLVFCKRSVACIRDMCSDANFYLSKDIVCLRGPADESRGEGYVNHTREPDREYDAYTGVLPTDVRMVIGIAQLDAMLPTDTPLETFLKRVPVETPLYIYGGFNVSTPEALAVFEQWPYRHVNFHGYQAFGPRTRLTSNGPLLVAIKEASINDPAAEFILETIRAWNAFMVDDCIKVVKEYGQSHNIHRPPNDSDAIYAQYNVAEVLDLTKADNADTANAKNYLRIMRSILNDGLQVVTADMFVPFMVLHDNDCRHSALVHTCFEANNQFCATLTIDMENRLLERISDRKIEECVRAIFDKQRESFRATMEHTTAILFSHAHEMDFAFSKLK